MSGTRRTGLGRGIGALIPTTNSDETRPVDVFFPNGEGADVPGVRLVNINPEAILPNSQQPRKEFRQEELDELVLSVREFGVLQPIVVREHGEGYELVMGERRLRAAKIAGLAQIPAIVRHTEDNAMLRDALLENLHRADLNPLEEASAYQQLLDDFGITQEELSQKIGRSRSQISNTIRLLRLPESVQRRVAAGVLSAGHARAVLSLDGEEAMERLAKKIVNENLSVRESEAAAGTLSAKVKRAVKPVAGRRRGHLDEVAAGLADRLDTRVKITLGAKKGSIVIDFATVGDLNRILSEIGQDPFGG